jgi:hypothetical protein
MTETPTDKKLSERFAAEAKTVNAAVCLLRHIGGAPTPHVSISADGEIGLSWVAGEDRLEMIVQPEDGRIEWCVKAGDDYPEHLQGNEPWTDDGVKKAGLSVATFWDGSDRAAESRPSAIREAVEGEREACAALVAAYGIAGMPFDVGSWTPGAVAAAIRARGEEK